MTNRSRPFECHIAGRTVGISLRHGGGLQEPGNVYVRCDERDCQYVDLNEAPCPLRIDMFADGSDRRVAAHLASRAGEHICYACLTEALGITHDQVRRATWRLRQEIGVVIRPSRCGSCRRRRVTIGLPAGATVSVVPGPPAIDIEPVRAVKRVIRHDEPSDNGDSGVRRLLEFITQTEGRAHCTSCLAFATDLPLADVRRALLLLEGAPELDRREAACEVCGRWQAVVAPSPTAAAD